MGEQHTRGPWFWALDNRDQRTNLMRSGSGDYVATPQADVGEYGLSVDRWTDVSDADADLIAAAPDLLAALQGAIGALEFSQDFHRDLGNEEQAFAADKLDNARRAIAKALGEDA